MIGKRLKCLLLCVFASALFSKAWAASNLSWQALIPEDERHLVQQFQVNHNLAPEEVPEQDKRGGFVEALHQTQQRIPGFIVPLEFDGDKISEFFLVSYFGACLHFPPPPPNQLIHVKATIDNIEPWQAVWLEGELSLAKEQAEDGTLAGYQMQLSRSPELISKAP
ncbi:DUF3299 domain-containing protein [Aliagarivorans marinus]|uniref:DUF3299 domain-containing protein n=1 Tax=Aliagarivorans marinus TaxID=561965 RepID=UPI00040E8F69|nr:DUF3299 domain-containing protein [Aliagarivorans marinus]